MKKFLLSLCCLMLLCGYSPISAATLQQLQSISDIDEDAEYVLGLENAGMHNSGTSSWGYITDDESQWLKYKLVKANDGKSFKAYTTIDDKTYYLQVPTSKNTFSMSTSSTADNTDMIIGTTQINETNYAVANKSTTDRHLRVGVTGLRSYAGTTGTMAHFYLIETASSPGTGGDTPSGPQNLTDAQFSWSAESASVSTKSADNTFPSLINTENLSVSYDSSVPGVATIDNNGEISLVAAGSTIISAIFAGNDDFNYCCPVKPTTT